MIDGSFNFNGINSATAYGIYVRQKQMVAPNKRITKKVIPSKNGTHKYALRSWDEVTIRLDLFCSTDMDRGTFRQVSAWLTQAGELSFWDEPGKYYDGEFERFPTFNEYNLLRMQEIPMDFVAFPFALGQERVINIASGNTNIVYLGTAPMPPVIEITNNSGAAINNLKITLTFEE